MRYHYEKPKTFINVGTRYCCDHPVYRACTLFMCGNVRGLAVIQQRYSSLDKTTFWTELDPWVASDIYLHPEFSKFLDSHAAEKDANGYYPAVTVRQLMHALKMKPLKKQPWETVFDRRIV